MKKSKYEQELVVEAPSTKFRKRPSAGFLSSLRFLISYKILIYKEFAPENLKSLKFLGNYLFLLLIPSYFPVAVADQLPHIPKRFWPHKYLLRVVSHNLQKITLQKKTLSLLFVSDRNLSGVSTIQTPLV